jgi:Kelch motif
MLGQTHKVRSVVSLEQARLLFRQAGVWNGCGFVCRAGSRGVVLPTQILLRKFSPRAVDPNKANSPERLPPYLALAPTRFLAQGDFLQSTTTTELLRGSNAMATGFGFASIAATRSARAFAAAVAWTDGTKVLVTGGVSSNGPYSAELYDDSTRSWTPSEKTTARSHHTATLLKSGHVLVVGGDNSTDPSTAEVYNPNTNSWQKVYNNLHSPRIAHTATLLGNGRVLITGGLPPRSRTHPDHR